MTTRTGEVIDVEPAELSPPQSNAVQAYTPPPAPANVLDADPTQFKVAVQRRSDNYSMLISWLCSNMAVGVDMVQVHFIGKSKCRHQGPPHCTPALEPGHWSAPDLSKRGAERVCGLLGLTAVFEGIDAYKRASLKGVAIKDILLECRLYKGDMEMSHGSGAASCEENYGDLNKTLKMAEKRAHIDAVKRCAGLSGLATEFARLNPPVDPQAAARRAGTQIRTEQHQGGNNRFATGAKLTHVPIGKNKGKAWRELSTAALEWYVQRCTDMPDIIRAAADELSKRQAPSAPQTQHAPQPPDPSTQKVDPEFDDDIPF